MQRSIHNLSNPNDSFFLKRTSNNLESNRSTFENVRVVYGELGFYEIIDRQISYIVHALPDLAR